jgi:predicted metalloprotease with PDZ domain
LVLGYLEELRERYTAGILKFFLVFLSLTVCLLAQEPVRYELRFPNAGHHEAEIRATFSGVKPGVLEVVMSRSSTGRYALHEFAKNVYHFRAMDAQGNALKFTRPNPYQWNVAVAKGTVVVEYTLFGDHADGTYAGIDATHAHLNTPASLAWAHGFEKIPASVKIVVPEGSNWRVATQLKPEANDTWTAPNMDFLFDSPIEISAHAMSEWSVGDSKFRLSLHHNGTDAEAEAYAKMCQAVVTEEEGVFGAFPKYDNGSYTFLVDYLPFVFGDGMEHRDSTVVSGTGNLKDGATQLIGTIAHEFFHSWNVKRIRPASLQPFDYEKANISGELWFAEGFTQYYGPLALKRAGINSLDRFTRGLSGAVNQVTTAPGRKVFNAIDMSRQAPFVDAAVAIDATNRANNFISYYTYGDAIALGVDLMIRTRFPGKSLDDWMRAMWKEHPDVQKAYTLEDLQTALAHATGSTEFASKVFEQYIYGMEPMPYEELLSHAGMVVRKSAAGKSWIGAASFAYSDKGVTLSAGTLRDTPLYIAGLDKGDVISAFGGKPVKTQAEFDGWLNALKPGEAVKLRVESRGGQKDVDLTVGESPAVEVVTFEEAQKSVTPEIAAFREAWLSSKAVHPLPKLEKHCWVCQRKYAFELEHCPYDGQDLHVLPGIEKAAPQQGRSRMR